MGDSCCHNAGRRSFIKSAAAGTAVIATSTPNVFAKAAAWPSINPDIDFRKVVYCTDTAMTTGGFPNAVTSRVEANMDEMAKSLASKGTPAEAWATIFRKPSGKTWGNVKVAIKTNCIIGYTASHAVVGKVCKALNGLGVPYGNMYIFDNSRDCVDKFSDRSIIPDGVVATNSLGGNASGFNGWQCAGWLVDGTIDILVNIANNKGHDQEQVGYFTLTMKNHIGTMKYSCPSLDELCSMNRSSQIVGGNPPRQQLCIVDSLWGACGGPFDFPGPRVNTLVMGTCSPAIDYLTVKNIRETIMGCSHPSYVLSRFLSEAGVSSGSDLQWTSVTPAGTTSKVLSPTILPDERSFTGTANVTLACATPNAAIYYTTNGTTPTNGSARYTTAIAVSATTTIKAIAYATGMTASDVVSATFTKVTLRDPDNPQNTVAGLAYAYYETGSTPSSVSQVDALSPVSSGNVSSFDNSVRGRDENYFLEFEGYIAVPADGVYTFYTTSDDGSALFIGTTKIVDNDGSHAAEEKSGTIGLKQGRHAIRVVFFQGNGGQELSVGIEGTGLTKRVIPSSMLFRTSSATLVGSLAAGTRGIISSDVITNRRVRVAVNMSARHECTLLSPSGKVMGSRAGDGRATYVFSPGLVPGVYLVKIASMGREMALQKVVVR